MAFILVVLPRISDTSIPIWMKLWGCIQLTLKIWIIIFRPGTGNGPVFSINQKFYSSKSEVEKLLIGKLVGFHNQIHTCVFCFSILKVTRINHQKLTLHLWPEILFSFDFLFQNLQLIVYGKQLTSGSKLKTEVFNMTMHIFRVNCIHPQSFIQIGILVSEILGNTTKMNAILGGPR